MAEGDWSEQEMKREAAKLIKKLRVKCLDDEEVVPADLESVPNSNAIAELKDLCLRGYHPFPLFDLVRHAGPLNAPKFTFRCSVASVEECATASTKKGAKQLAAQKVAKILQEKSAVSTSKETPSVSQVAKKREEENRKKIKAYKEYTKSGPSNSSDATFDPQRHNFFKKLDMEKRMKAYHIFNDESITSSKDKVDLVLKALQIPYSVQEVPAKNSDPMILVELHCELDVLLAGEGDSVYDEMIEYLQDMLK